MSKLSWSLNGRFKFYSAKREKEKEVEKEYVYVESFGKKVMSKCPKLIIHLEVSKYRRKSKENKHLQVSLRSLCAHSKRTAGGICTSFEQWAFKKKLRNNKII